MNNCEINDRRHFYIMKMLIIQSLFITTSFFVFYHLCVFSNIDFYSKSVYTYLHHVRVFFWKLRLNKIVRRNMSYALRQRVLIVLD